MNVDYVAARQAIADLKSHPATDKELIEEVLVIMSKLSEPGAVRRKEFDLNQFLTELAKVDFSKRRAFHVASLLEVMGKCMSDGIRVADHGFGV